MCVCVCVCVCVHVCACACVHTTHLKPEEGNMRCHGDVDRCHGDRGQIGKSLKRLEHTFHTHTRTHVRTHTRTHTHTHTHTHILRAHAHQVSLKFMIQRSDNREHSVITLCITQLFNSGAIINTLSPFATAIIYAQDLLSIGLNIRYIQYIHL